MSVCVLLLVLQRNMLDGVNGPDQDEHVCDRA